VSRQSFPPWFDPGAFRDTFELDVRGLPIFEVHYEVTATDNVDGVDVVVDSVDDRGDYRIEVLDQHVEDGEPSSSSRGSGEHATRAIRP
jgi:hypothetical protein